VEAGGLMSYGPNLSEAYRQLGAYAGKILGGTKTEALRVETRRVADFELAVNGKAAKGLKLEIPQALQRAVV